MDMLKSAFLTSSTVTPDGIVFYPIKKVEMSIDLTNGNPQPIEEGDECITVEFSPSDCVSVSTIDVVNAELINTLRKFDL